MIFDILIAVTGVTIMSFGYLFQKIGLSTEMINLQMLKSKDGLIWLVGTGMTVLGSLLFFIALGSGDLTVIQPITGLSPAIVVILNFVVLKTKIHKNEIIGIIASILGIILITYRTGAAVTTFNLSSNVLNYFSIVSSAILVILIITLNYIPSLDAGLIEGIIAGLTAGMASIYVKIGLNMFLSQQIIHWTLLAFIIMQTTAFIALQRALHHGRMDKIITIFTNINIFLPVGFGILLLNEMVNSINFLGMILIIAGVLLLAKNYSEIFEGPANSAKLVET